MAGEPFRRLDLEHPEVEARIVEEISEGVPVYYDRSWPMTERFCDWLVRHPESVEDRHVLVVGAGVGMEAVVAGRFAERLEINDMAPVALELLAEQLRENGIEPAATHACSYADVPLSPGLDLVLACFTVFDEGSAAAMERLLERTGERGVPVLFADRDLGGHLGRLLDATPRSTEWLVRDDGMRVVRVGWSRLRA